MLNPIIQTEKAVYIAVSAEKDGRVSTSLDRKVPLVTIRSFAMSSLRDDWVVRYLLLQKLPECGLISIRFFQALNVTSSEEGDPVFSCYLKTELMTCLSRLTQGSMSIIIGPT